jgi:hypothetical protein
VRRPAGSWRYALSTSYARRRRRMNRVVAVLAVASMLSYVVALGLAR